MGVDAKAFLWFGTKLSEPDSSKPAFVPEDWRDLVALEERLSARGIKLVTVPSPEQSNYAIGILSSYQHHDWDFPPEKFEMHQPTEEDKALLLKEAAGLNLEVNPDEIGWYMAGTMW